MNSFASYDTPHDSVDALNGEPAFNGALAEWLEAFVSADDAIVDAKDDLVLMEDEVGKFNQANFTWQALLWKSLLGYLVVFAFSASSSFSQIDTRGYSFQPSTRDYSMHPSHAALEKHAIKMKRQAYRKIERQIFKDCDKTGKIITIQNFKILCIIGNIKINSFDFSTLKENPFDLVYVNTGGGNVLSAIKLGQLMQQNKSALLISGRCLSSCANYLVPSASEIIIMKNAFIGFHGTPERSEKIYFQKLNAHRRKQNIPETKSKQDREKKLSFYKRDIHVEVDFYLDLGVEESFATFYHHAYKRVRNANKPECRSTRAVFFIMGPKHAKAYGLNVRDSWFPTHRADFKSIIKRLPRRSLVFDFDAHPFVTPLKFVDPNICDISVKP